MNKILTCSFFSFLFLLIPSQISAQVEINEIVSDNDPEWIELYNTSSTNISLDNCVLRMQDNPDTNQKITFGSGDNISQFLVIRSGDYNWSSNWNWLNNDGDKVILTCLGQEKTVVYGNVSGASVEAPDQGKSIGRAPDGTGSFQNLNNASPGEPNQPAPTATPTASPIPTPSKTPTPTPTPTLIKTPTPAKSGPTLTSAQVVKNPTASAIKLSPARSPLSANTDSSLVRSDSAAPLVLGETTSSSQSSEKKNSLVSGGAKISLVLGMIFCGFSIIIFSQKYKTLLNQEQ